MTRPPGVLARDISAAAAFGSVALSGVLPAAIWVVFPLAFMLSLLGIRPLAGRRSASVLALLMIGGGLAAAVAMSILDLVIAAVSFATLVTCHRMLAEPTAQASRQVLLSGLLLVSGGAALTGEVLFAVFLIIYFAAATWSMSWLVLSSGGDEVEGAERRSISRQLAAGNLATLLMGLSFFVLFPRLSWNIANRRSAPGLGGVTGMTETVKLGGAGDIKTSTRVAFRVQLIPDQPIERLNAYFVGRHFDTFDGAEWTSSGQPSEPAARVVLHTRTPRLNVLTQDFELTPAYGSRTLVAIDTPSTFGRVRGQTIGGSQPMPLIHVAGDQVLAALEANTITYNATSDLSDGIDRDEPTAATSQLPPLDPRVEGLADSLLADATTPDSIARTLERELKTRYAYSLDLPGEVADPLADFLFVRKRGHCEDFATALAVMLRLKGIPSRVVTGFYGGERSGLRYVVRAGDAHAWVEGFLGGRWVRLDATPESGRALLSSALMGALAAAWEAIEEWWRSRVLDYSFSDQLQFARGLVRPPASAFDASAAPPHIEAPDLSLWPILLSAAALLALAVLMRKRVHRLHPATEFLEQIEERLRARAITVDTPLEELSHRLNTAHHPLGAALTHVCRRYLEARFGDAPVSADERTRLLKSLE